MFGVSLGSATVIPASLQKQLIDPLLGSDVLWGTKTFRGHGVRLIAKTWLESNTDGKTIKAKLTSLL